MPYFALSGRSGDGGRIGRVAGTRGSMGLEPHRAALPVPRGTRSEAGRPRTGDPRQRAKLVPQPQEAVAFGLWILKDWPIRSSTKSISEPFM